MTREVLAIRIVMLVLLAMGIVLLLTACSAEAIRNANTPDLKPMNRDAERDYIRERGVAFCATYPDDVACKGPKRGKAE